MVGAKGFLKPNVRRSAYFAATVSLLLSMSCKQRSEEADSSLQSAGRGDPRLSKLANDLRSLEEEGFSPGKYSAKGQKGLDNILTGKAIPFPLPKLVWDNALAGIGNTQTEAEQWLIEGTVPTSWNRKHSTKTVIGLGDAVYSGDEGVEVVTKTCLQCHAGTVAGKVVAGLPHSNWDSHYVIGRLKSVLPKVTALNVAKKVTDPFGIASATTNWAIPKKQAYDDYISDFKSYAENFFMPPFDYAYTRGDNHGAYSVWLMAARMENPAKYGILAGRGADQKKIDLFESTFLPNIDNLPWWNIKFKKRAYWFYDATFHSPAAFNLNFYTPRAKDDSKNDLVKHAKKLKKKVEIIDEVLQFARETEPPSMPRSEQLKLAANWAEVERGAKIFHEKKSYDDTTCASCHGSYKFVPSGNGNEFDVEVDYPSLGLQDVGTDPLYNKVLQDFQPLARNINATAAFYHNVKDENGNKIFPDPKYAPFSYVVAKKGYIAPVLVGIWASAPYLHNGSVPTLRDLFRKAEDRPAIWGRRIYDITAYDFENVGLAHDVIGLLDWQKRRDAARTWLLQRDRGASDPSVFEFRRFFNTLVTSDKETRGRRNNGHAYGTEWSEADINATITFMKALAPIDADNASTKIRRIYPKEAIPVWADGNYLDPYYGPNESR